MNNYIDHELKDLITHAYNNSPFYKQHYVSIDDVVTSEDFQNLPLLTKDLLSTNFDNILITPYRYIKRNMLELIQTSGSTGRIMEVLWERQELIKSNICLWRKRQEWYGINTKNKKCEFVTSSIAGKSKIFSQDDAILLSNNTLSLSTIYFGPDTLHNYYKKILDFSPEWLYTPISVLITFVDFLKTNSLPSINSLKYIELYGEQVSQEALNYVKDFFNIPIAIMYGCKELNGIALTCPHNKMHVLEKNVYVECDENNEAIISSRKNTVFPLIRYKLGDKIKLGNCNCGCGTSGMIIERIYGRETILTYVNKTTGITVNSLLNSIYVVNARLDFPFIQYKIWEKDNTYQIHLFIKKQFWGWQETIRNEFHKCFEHYKVPIGKVQVLFSETPLKINPNTAKLNLFEIMEENI